MADADTDYINYFEADLTATDRIYLVRFQRHIHDATNVKTMGVIPKSAGVDSREGFPGC